jgi:hypothetical protein
MARQPLVDWLGVEIFETEMNADGTVDNAEFIVADNGEWAEFYTKTKDGVVVERPDFDFGTIAPWELKILDTLLDRVNRETIPTTPTLVTQTTLPNDHAVTLINGPINEDVTCTLFQKLSDDSPASGTYFAYDDSGDIAEITAVTAFIIYLEHKYGSNCDMIG